MPLTRIEPAAIADTRGVNFRNIIINGDMSVAQRGTSFTGITSTQTYTLDRWFGRSFSTSSMNVSQSTDAPDGFLYSAKCQKPSGQSASIMRFEQPFETNNIVYLRGQKVTVSFYAKKGADYSVTNNALPVVLFAGDGTERARNITAFDNETAPINTSVTLTGSWQKFSVTSSNLPSDVSQLALQFQPTTTVTAGADESFFITGVQLEAGEVASDFEFLSYDVNLRRCYRYYWGWWDKADATSNGAIGGLGVMYSSSSLYIAGFYPVDMRATPSLDQASGTNYYRFLRNGATDFLNEFTLSTGNNRTNKRGYEIFNTAEVSGTGGQAGWIRCNNTDAFVNFDAEL